jgi:hypothetical protein
MDGEPLMTPDSTGEAQAVLAAYPGIAGVALIEHGTGPGDRCVIAYVMPSGPGLDVPELHAYARKALPGGSMPAAIMVVDQIPVTAAGTVNAAALPVPELAGLLPYQAPATPRQELLCDLFGQVRRRQRLLRPGRPVGGGNGAGRADQFRPRRSSLDGRPVQGANGR